MKNKGLVICRINAEFMVYTQMVEFIEYLNLNDHERLINKLKKDLIDSKKLENDLNNAITSCKKEISFIENYLDDCGVNVYEA